MSWNLKQKIEEEEEAKHKHEILFIYPFKELWIDVCHQKNTLSLEMGKGPLLCIYSSLNVRNKGNEKNVWQNDGFIHEKTISIILPQFYSGVSRLPFSVTLSFRCLFSLQRSSSFSQFSHFDELKCVIERTDKSA